MHSLSMRCTAAPSNYFALTVIVSFLQVRDESTFKNVIGFCRVPLCSLQSVGTGTGSGSDPIAGGEATPADAVMTGQAWYPMYVPPWLVGYPRNSV